MQKRLSKTLFQKKKQFSETFLLLCSFLVQYLINPFFKFHKHCRRRRPCLSRNNILTQYYKMLSPSHFPNATICCCVNPSMLCTHTHSSEIKAHQPVNQEGRSPHKQHQLPRAFVIYIVIIAAFAGSTWFYFNIKLNFNIFSREKIS